MLEQLGGVVVAELPRVRTGATVARHLIVFDMLGRRNERGVAHLRYGGVPDMPLRGANDAVDGRRALCVLTDARLQKQQLEPLDVNACALEMSFQRLP